MDWGALEDEIVASSTPAARAARQTQNSSPGALRTPPAARPSTPSAATSPIAASPVAPVAPSPVTSAPAKPLALHGAFAGIKLKRGSDAKTPAVTGGTPDAAPGPAGAAGSAEAPGPAVPTKPDSSKSQLKESVQKQLDSLTEKKPKGKAKGGPKAKGSPKAGPKAKCKGKTAPKGKAKATAKSLMKKPSACKVPMKRPSSNLKPVGKDEDHNDDDLNDDGADDGEHDGHEGEEENEADFGDGHGIHAAGEEHEEDGQNEDAGEDDQNEDAGEDDQDADEDDQNEDAEEAAPAAPPASRFVLGQGEGQAPLTGTILQQKTAFCRLAQNFYVDAGYPRMEAWNLAQSDWMVSPHRAALIGTMPESEQVRRRFRKPKYAESEVTEAERQRAVDVE
eukprot:s1331_g21.t1